MNLHIRSTDRYDTLFRSTDRSQAGKGRRPLGGWARETATETATETETETATETKTETETETETATAIERGI